MKIWLGVILCTLFFVPVSAQTNGVVLLYEGNPPQSLIWSADGRYLIFQPLGATPRVKVENDWYLYDSALTANALTLMNIWPLYPEFSNDEANTFILETNNQISFVYNSPDQKFIVYGFSSNAEVGLYDLVIGNRETQAIFVKEEIVLDPFAGPASFNVIWNSDGSSFVLKTRAYSGGHLYYYVTGYQQMLAETVVTRLDILSAGQDQFVIAEVFDITTDGQILLSAWQYMGSQQSEYPFLLTYSVTIPSSLQVLLTEDVLGASFCPSDEETIVFVQSRAITTFNLIDRSTVSVELPLPEEIMRGLFSPNGNHLAVVTSASRASANQLYVIDIQSLMDKQSTCFNELP